MKNIIISHEHLSGRQVFNVVRDLSKKVWPRPFRETVASEVIEDDPTIIGAFKVMRRLELKDYSTGFNHLKRYASDTIERQID